MAKKKSGGESAAPEKASSKAAAEPAKAAKAASKKAEPAPAPAAAKAGGAAKAGAKKAEPPVKLTPAQGELLRKIGGSETGYLVEKKAEQRTIDALLERKLIKKGAKDKASGFVNYSISSAGKKHPSLQQSDNA